LMGFGKRVKSALYLYPSYDPKPSVRK